MRCQAWAGLKTPSRLTFPGNSDAVQPGFLETQMKRLRDNSQTHALQLRNPSWDSLDLIRPHMSGTNH